ncbi:MAG: STM4011 family radical SAM protein [Pirellulaceae bacterium]
MTVTNVLYRGSLSSCNYACGYCPFGKTSNTREELDRDREQLERFVDWAAGCDRPLGIMITPWGEAIIHRYYRNAMIRLSRMVQVQRIVIQTNLSGHLDDLENARCDRMAIWATYHPGETNLTRFLERCATLQRLGIRFSVGVVGLREHFPAIAELRQLLAKEVYVWINVPKSSGIQYSDDDIRFLSSVDPYFRWNTRHWPTFGKLCRTGQTSFAVDGGGDVRRCHFVDEVIGNIYQDDIWARLMPRTCPNTTCGCHIGYVHRPSLGLDQLYGSNILERIPQTWPAIDWAKTDATEDSSTTLTH